ncbi:MULTISPECIES: molybdate ABC transporter substrate-binding protein [unclassified Uliginosibacterium]|uniref:molybdate ABC transporter substrate-binding protein n=1 Tax=unclassified Uliginosibacterium TaxID=2621521 RepID=UPI000C7DB1E9|nr:MULTISPECIES: molybdate ABC transporter substrate-binding protein [unclassified Uliginosibacterium]MDO6388085.1 molybdate ABC transporter substrate-binding protein [Uliginosibacterium sp. 31-12]PLK48219.1 molybdate ABC transporter substrate-binding protein [Uliginosibacterium sp. TH139]
MKRTRFLKLIGFLLALFPLLAIAQESLLIAGGAGYKRPIDEIAQAFEAASRIKVERIYGHMGQVLAQARASDKVAVVFGEQDVLEKAGQPAFNRFIPIGRGRLVLAWPVGRDFKSLTDLQAAGVQRIGVADLKQAIFGKAARESLQKAGLLDVLEPRLVVVPTVPQVSAYLISGEVDAGFINLTEALGIRTRIGGYLELAQEQYAPIHITAGVLAGQESPALKAFLDYLQTPAARAVLQRYGL